MNRPMGGRRRAGDGGVQWPKAVVLIVVLVVIGFFILDRTGTVKTGSPTTTKKVATAPTSVTTAPAPVTTTTVLPAAQVKVQVLNGVGSGSLASEWSKKLKTTFGYTTEPPDNSTAKVPSSAIYILTLGYQAEADQLATQVGLSAGAVVTTVPPPASAPIPASERSTANLVLVIGPDLAGTA